MSDVNAKSSMERMCLDFLERTGADEATKAICLRLIRNKAAGDTCLPLSAEECEAVKGFSVVSVAPDDAGLFVLDGNLLFTRREWNYEQTIKAKLDAMNRKISDNTVIPEEPAFDALNPDQREAVKMMCENRFCILTGGPGTGKTYTIARAVKLAQQQQGDLRIGLAAPTGKAAERVNESIQKDIQALGLTGIHEATTLHTLLQPHSNFVQFKRNAKNPLDLDWLIVDEASMVGLPLMAKLLDALPENCRLTLVGDAHQLASVEHGNVFGDLCRLEQFPQCRLTESRRFPAGQSIDLLAKAVNAGRADDAVELLKNGTDKVHWTNPLGINSDFPWSRTDFDQKILSLLNDFVTQTTPEGALEKVNCCRILCAMHQGNYGMERINAHIRHLLEKRGGAYPIPVLIAKNDRDFEVSNGDVGVMMSTDSTKLYLPGGRVLPMALLPDVEIAFAFTVHKSQGSEYDNVVIVLPSDSSLSQYGLGESLLTRELLYTAITRTRQEVFLYGGERAIRQCCNTAISRKSGLGCE